MQGGLARLPPQVDYLNAQVLIKSDGVKLHLHRRELILAPRTLHIIVVQEGLVQNGPKSDLGSRRGALRLKHGRHVQLVLGMRRRNAVEPLLLTGS